ncbi:MULTISPECIES: peptide-methionine (S)-S-oxide reductase MsrA [unclassified Chelatococcus]|jgi:peptide-methionine (S)-S-oxide reductase|uniref:peptide-methionine (S)-S-oxide reductase MsrA n=1 Tax=unclassified Chelatococcus TaxID=2638111 RepID=UPI001BCD8281|nr:MULTISPECIES: peptide-methionine (S)-S-oxide reductase MsrA [unclassified Chelatococcus]CAH1656548.1 Peptide methionine sulfoxide reductase MsrA 2 [Hyphomicrobiales bacterium]MBS7742437.1 peptide-methionine (S)-S-oxide reductase MsrA [Chelatococcus sp. HY11]MBX3542445.1 peptide-methionine (S)-S-oxide reductase MsrA [Chelatococcus sp.]MCO5075338.1 peptide-methionine (S)-S-oxide reductase MsrA [Chelatococcus sp.]CAH1695869.1 Peptide methionine sulfoxide reductase MsrA 2 [Hyphomicrobiales bact
MWSAPSFLAGTVLLALCSFASSGPAAAQEGIAIPPPAVDREAAGSNSETAVLAGGCFWGVQGIYQRVQGVRSAVSGYAGGTAETAHYEMVGSGRTGHAEAVEITYDPRQISYGKLLQIFFSVAHDPTELNRQGPDIGPQYRTAIFPQNSEQAEIAKSYIAQLDQARVFNAAIVTKIESAYTFYPAEAYHQDYLTLNPTSPYIVYNDLPKIENLKKLFSDRYRATPALVKAKLSN